jgi:dihydroorotate dehydrogenase electron transfer subunit
LDGAFHQDAAVTLVGEGAPEDLPLQVEVQPTLELLGVCKWADFVAFEVARELLPELREIFPQPHYAMKAEAQVLVRTPMPCGALAACGVCTIEAGGRALLACEDGPVFDFDQVMGWSKRA